MGNKILTKGRATHSGVWVINKESGIEIECYVTDDKKRMLSLKGAGRALDLKGAGSTAVVRNLSSKWIQPYLTDNLAHWVEQVSNKDVDRIKVEKGPPIIPLEGDLFVDICKAYINAQKNGVFTDKNGVITQGWSKQNETADKLFHIIAAFAKIGIVALIDEITGYQEERDRDELHRLLEIYLVEERLSWAKMFPDEFYRQIYKLKGWQYPKGSTKRTPLVGKITNEIVYKRLPQGVLDELKKRNPVLNETNRRKWKHHQFLSNEIGQADLRDHLLQIIAIMRASSNWGIFKRLFARAFPMDGDQLELPMEIKTNQ